MRNAETILGIIHERGKQGLPLEDLYRQLFNPDLYLAAYGKIYRNQGAMTPGTTKETVDGMSLAKIGALIEQLRSERYRWTPVRRTHIPKKDGKKRPLGIPTWSNKLLQEVIRLLLEAYYEPQFSDQSHGFRPQRGCHTTLTEIRHTWRGTAWFIEGDISKCFDSLDHEVLMSILGEKIHDNRFLRLIRNLLQAGYLEEWRYHRTMSGTPQGGVVSPVLSNIYLDRLDKYVTEILIPANTRGSQRRGNLAYQRLSQNARNADHRGDKTRAEELRRLMRQLPTRDPHDPDYRRLRYVRYADDFLLGFAGPRSEAETIKRQVGEFLRNTLKLELSEMKTLITHARSEPARFLGYEIETLHDDDKRSETNHRRCINGSVGLRIPSHVVQAKSHHYMVHGKPIHRTELTNDRVFSIVSLYQQEYRGIVEYYRLAYNLHRMGYLRWIMEQSLTKTLAHKLKISVPQVYKRYQATIPTDDGPRQGLEIVVEQGEGKKPLVAHWGGISLKWRPNATLTDQIPIRWFPRTELEQRLRANTCELCSSTEKIRVHHIRAMKDLQQKGRAEKPLWMQVMAARRRKTLVVCHECHKAIHGGRLQHHDGE